MKRTLFTIVVLIGALTAQPPIDLGAAAARHTPTMAQFMSAAFPMELVAARKTDRIAWISNDKGLRNVYTAAGPDFRPVRVTAYMNDDGVNTTQLSISDDGSVVSFTRGHEKNRFDWVASPEADPRGVERAIYAAKTAAPGLS